jgi:nitrite reductase/ring-hydroxylating ferredoxin subunit
MAAARAMPASQCSTSWRKKARPCGRPHGVAAWTLSFILGSAILSSFRAQSRSWLRAASVDDVPDDEPLEVTLRLVRHDGLVQVVDRPAVYLIKSGSNEVRAMQATCTHLGCRTSYERKTKRILCPCHGGAYNTQGEVNAGPPPASLATLPARVESGQVFVAL